MKSDWKLYSYPSCSSCRQAERWLAQQGVTVERAHIYNDPPSPEELGEMAKAHPQGIAGFIGTRSRIYRELGLKDKNLSVEEWFTLLEETPRLLRRPILWNGETVLVGWKESDYEATFGDDQG